MTGTYAALHSTHRSAVAWIAGGHALVATNTPRGQVTVAELSGRAGSREADPFLASVVDAIGDCERVLIMGPGVARLALEREYVTIFHRPERLVDVEPSGPMNREDLVDRLRTLAS